MTGRTRTNQARRWWRAATTWAVPVEEGVRDASYWRRRLIGAALVSCAVLGGVTIVPNVLLAWQAGATGVLVVDAVAYGLILWALLARGAPLAWRAATIPGVAWALGTYFSWGWGPMVAGPVWLAAAPVIAAVLIGRRASRITLGATAGSLALIGVALARGALPWAGPTAAPLPLPGALGVWSIVGTNVLLICALVVTALTVLSEGLDREVGDRRQAEAERTRLGEAVAQSGDAILLFDLEGLVRVANPAAIALLGGPLEGRAGAALGLAAEAGDALADPSPWMVALAGGSWRGRCRLVGGESTVHLDGSCSPVRDEAGGAQGALLVLRDVTREAHLEERLRQAARLEAVGTLVSGVAHDFNNLLQPILVNAESLASALPVGDPGQPLAHDIAQAAERGRGLVRRVLTFSRGAALDRRPTRVADVVTETVRLLRGRVPDTVRLTVQVDPTLWVAADPAELHHALVNLATNGLQAMPGEGELGIEGTATRAADVPALSGSFAAETVLVCLTVRDTGSGMDAHTLARAFDPFFTTKPPGEGTGLGLASVHGTITALGGMVVPWSRPGEGTAMRLYLPRLAVPPAEEQASSAAAPDRAAAQRVLLVDDEPLVLRTMERLLRRGGWEVIAIGDPREAVAWAAARGDELACVVTDLSMPHLTGLELAARLRADHPDLPTVLLTGFLESETHDDAVRAAVTRVLRKPIASAELLAAVAEAAREV